jgi:hypothetical protein
VIEDDKSQLLTIQRDADATRVAAALRQDLVVLIRNVGPDRADRLVRDVADRFDMLDRLELQAGFAGFLGHRQTIGEHFMSVNERGDYQFIPPHSEGSAFLDIQLAAFYAYDNTTDGGETILMNVDDASAIWPSLREKARRVRLGKAPILPSQIARARGLYQVRIPDDLLTDSDEILEEHPTELDGVTVVDVLARPGRRYSRILGREVYAYWDSVASIDHDSAHSYVRLLRMWGLLREPAGGLDVCRMDNASHRRLWHSGVDHAQLFKCRIVHKLIAGDLIVFNNMTWPHAVTNWSPESGSRQVAGAFA